MLRREFKIHGIVAGDNFKDGLSFVSLARQIESGIKACYKEAEIVEAVIRAVSPSLKLRSYLEMIEDLSLSRLIMKANCKQKSATELYQKLSVLHQQAGESPPQDFLVRALNLKQQIIFVLNATDGSIKYEPSLVQALFLHVLETGLQNEAVRAKLRPLLEVASVTDEQLMEKVNRIMAAELEHQNKMGVAGRKGVRVNQVETASPPSNQLCQPSSSQTPQNESIKSQKREPKPNTLVTALETVQSNLASLKEAFDRVSAPVERNSTWPYASGNQSQFQRRQCNSCRTAGVDNCNHCFKCGSTDHFARGCRRPSGNGQRLRQRDRV